MIDLLSAAIAMCSADKSGTDYLLEFKFVEAFACAYGNEVGVVVTGFIVWGSIAMSIYLTTGDIRIPSVLLLLTGGVIIPRVAAPGVAMAVIMLLLLASGIVTALYYRWSR